MTFITPEVELYSFNEVVDLHSPEQVEHAHQTDEDLSEGRVRDVLLQAFNLQEVEIDSSLAFRVLDVYIEEVGLFQDSHSTDVNQREIASGIAEVKFVVFEGTESEKVRTEEVTYNIYCSGGEEGYDYTTLTVCIEPNEE